MHISSRRRESSEGAVTFTFSSRRTSARAYFDAACCRHRCSYFAAWITLICGSVTVVEYKWSSARRADHRPDRHQWICYVGRLLSYHTHSSPSPPRHIPSTTHFPSPATRTSAGYFVAPAGVLALRGLARLVGRGRSTFTCCCWSDSSPRRLERVLARLPSGQQTAPLDSVAVPQPYAVASVGRVGPMT